MTTNISTTPSTKAHAPTLGDIQGLPPVLVHEDLWVYEKKISRERDESCPKKWSWRLFFSALFFAFLLLMWVNHVIQTKPLVRHAGIATEDATCTRIGSQILFRGGNAADAAIAAIFCLGTVNLFASGIGGGAMVLLGTPNSHYTFLDARETAPAASAIDMFHGNATMATRTGLSIGVPGEVAGLYLLHKKYGSMSWKAMIQPSMDLANHGFVISSIHAQIVQFSENLIRNSPSLSKIYVKEDHSLVQEGDMVKRPEYAQTLQTLLKEGPDAFYRGNLSSTILEEIQSAGGILTAKDLAGYSVRVRQPLVSTYHGGTVIGSPPPASGAILALMLNVLSSLGRNSSLSNGSDTLYSQRLIETFKHGYARRTDLADPDFVNMSTSIHRLLNKQYADQIAANISDSQTFPISYYHPHFYNFPEAGTTHLSVVDGVGMVVAFTSTINLHFGSRVMGKTTGIVYNNQMDDFSSPNITNRFDLWPSIPNFIQPGMRPLSSACPTILTYSDGSPRAVLGASGGARILSSVLQTVLNLLEWNQSTVQSVVSARMHHQLFPHRVRAEYNVPPHIVEGLRRIGHVVEVLPFGFFESAVQLVTVSPTDKQVFAFADSRKGGAASTFPLSGRSLH